MPKKISNDVILERLDNLTERVADGFKVMHEKQDKTNGNVMANTEFRLKSEGTISSFKWLIGLIGSGTLITIAKLFKIL